VFVYHGGLDFEGGAKLVAVRDPNVVLEVLDASVMAAGDGPLSSDAVAGQSAVHVELRPAAAKRLAALLLAPRERNRIG
jgi:hypothetical protein